MLCFEIILIEQMVIVKKGDRNIDEKILEFLKTYYEGFQGTIVITDINIFQKFIRIGYPYLYRHVQINIPAFVEAFSLQSIGELTNQ